MKKIGIAIIIVLLCLGAYFLITSKLTNPEKTNNIPNSEDSISGKDSDLVQGNGNVDTPKYDIEIPPDWHRLGNSQDNEYYSTEKVGSPLEMTSQGVWLTIGKSADNDLFNRIANISPKETAIVGLSTVSKVESMAINGLPAYRYSAQCSPNAETECYYSAHYLVKEKETLYEITFLSQSKETIDDNSFKFDQIAQTFELKR